LQQNQSKQFSIIRLFENRFCRGMAMLAGCLGAGLPDFSWQMVPKP
jgi:hypothetical protein